MQQTASRVLLCEPLHFAFNEQAAVSNSFQNQLEISAERLQETVQKEFQQAVKTLQSFGVEVTVIKGDAEIKIPDAVFPNNWFSTHKTGELILYPMAVPNRRAERRVDVIQDLIEKYNYQIVDLSHFESNEPPQFLEGTGSLIFDHISKVVYAALSPRTDKNLVDKVAEILGYESVCFRSYGKSGELIYHTNVMMCVGETFALIGKHTVDSSDWPLLEASLLESGKEIIELTNEQIYQHFAGNMLQLSNQVGQKLLVMSITARKSLTESQIETLSKHNDYLVALDIPTIEFVGGGSARCMLAELYLKQMQ
ncbi:MAG: arginine deiminase-related protein [bacterium]|nr:arginine deiminase-related protein [bacterium]